MKKEKQHIPAGYKLSPLGPIPEDWEVKRLGEIANKIGDGIHGTPAYTDKSDYYFINGNNLNDGKIVITEATKCVPYSEYLKYKKDLTKNTILISINGSIGNIALYNEEKVMLGKSAAYITIPNYKYFYHLLQSTQVLSIFEKELTGSTIRNLSLDSIRNLKVALPSQVEIDNITRVIDLWDTAISKQAQLVEKLTLRKRGLMQQLLTGKKRLKGFGGEWKMVKLGEIGTFFKGSGVPKDSITSEGHKCLTYGDLYTKYDYVISNVKSFIDDNTANNSTRIQYGDICFAGSGETKEDIGKCAAFIDDQYGYAGGDIIIFRAKESNPITLSYILNSDSVIRQKSNMGQGHSVVHIYPYQLEKLRFKLPPKVEQDTIASILMDADKEIELAEEKLANLQSQKRGLMQQLLTGKKRINKN